MTIVVNGNTMLKNFPAEFAQRMAMRTGGGADGTQPPSGGQTGNMMRPPQTNQTGGQSPAAPNGMGQGMRQGGGMRGGRGEFDDLLERFPTISLADLKVGDSIAVSSTSNSDANRYTAIKLVSGVEAFLKAPQMTMGGGRRGGGGGQDSGFSIPGLDGGFGNP